MASAWRVLVVDDEKGVRDNLGAFLRDEGFNVQVAASGEEGLLALQSQPADLAVVDMRLPDISGDDFIRRAHDSCDDLAFIVHTGSIEYSLPADIRAIGVDDNQILYKPLHDLSQLASRVYQLLM